MSKSYDMYEPDDDQWAKPYDHTGELSFRRRKSTPDFLKLKSEGWQMVFVYGTLKAGHYNHQILTGGRTLGRARTCLGTYELFDTGSFPVALDRSTATIMSGAIEGELYYIPPLLMLDLDELEGNGIMYQRKQSWFYAHDQEKSGKNKTLTQSVQAWIYLGVPSFWKERALLSLIRPTVKETKKIVEWKG